MYVCVHNAQTVSIIASEYMHNAIGGESETIKIKSVFNATRITNSYY